MADPWAGAQSNVDDQKKAMLQAMAQSGSAGRAAFEEARKAVEAEQQAAMQRAAQRAALVGMPNVGVEGQVGEAYGSRLSALDSAKAGFDADLARRQSANENYFGQVGAALPFLQAKVTEKLGTREAEIKKGLELARLKAEQERQDQLDREQRQYERQLESEARAEARALAREGRAAARDAAKEKSKPLSDAAIETQLIGAARRADEQGLVGTRFPDMPKGVLQGGKPSLSEIARQIGVSAGYDPNVVYGRLGPEDDVRVARAQDALATIGRPKTDPAVKAAATRSRVTADDYVKIVNGAEYKRILDQSMQLLNAGTTREEILADWRADLLNRGPGKAPLTRTFQILESELAALFPSITETNRLTDYAPAE